MAEGFKILQYDESEQLNKNGSNWIFWKTQIVPYLKVKAMAIHFQDYTKTQSH